MVSISELIDDDEAHRFFVEHVDDVVQVECVAREPVELGDLNGVAIAHELQELGDGRTFRLAMRCIRRSPSTSSARTC